MVDHGRVVVDNERLHRRSTEGILHPNELHAAKVSCAHAAALIACGSAHVWMLCRWRTPEPMHGDLPGGAADVKRYVGWNVLQRHCRHADGLSQTDVREAG